MLAVVIWWPGKHFLINNNPFIPYLTWALYFNPYFSLITSFSLEMVLDDHFLSPNVPIGAIPFRTITQHKNLNSVVTFTSCG